MSVTLVEAWKARHKRAEDGLREAAAAPGLFKPEYVNALREQYATAAWWVRYFMGQRS